MRTRQTVAHAIATYSQMPEGERRKLELRCEEAPAAVIALRTHSDQLDQQTVDFYIDAWTPLPRNGPPRVGKGPRNCRPVAERVEFQGQGRGRRISASNRAFWSSLSEA
jgi:hypothetical protein